MHFQPLGADLETVHRLDGGLRRGNVVERHKAEALGQVGLLIDEHLGGHHVAEREERRRQIGIGELLRQVVDEQVATLGTCGKYTRDHGESRGSCEMRARGNLPSICLPAAAATACAIVGLGKGVVVNAAVAAEPNWGRAAYGVKVVASAPAVPVRIERKGGCN